MYVLKIEMPFHTANKPEDIEAILKIYE